MFPYTVESRYLEVDGTNFYKFKITRSANKLKKSPQRQIMVGESNQNIFSIQIDASSSQNSNNPSSRHQYSHIIQEMHRVLTLS